MKKFAIGIVVGAVLMFSGQAFADSISLIGKKVGSEATVILNDIQLSDAIIVDSKSYAPVRDIAEAFGASVDFETATKEKKAVIRLDSLTTSEINLEANTIAEKEVLKLISSTDGSIIPLEHQLVILNQEKPSLELELSRLKQAIINSQEEIMKYEDRKKSENGLNDAVYDKNINSLKTSISENEKLIKGLEEKLAAVNKFIVAIEKEISSK